MSALRTAAFFAAVLLAGAAHGQAGKNILLVFDEDKDYPGLAMANRGLQDAFKAGLEGEVRFYTESLNLSQFKGADYDRALGDHFRRKYADKPLDLVVAVLAPSLDFVLRQAHGPLAGRPVVFLGVDATDIEGRPPRAGVSGVVVRRTFAPTVDIALKLQPRMRELVVVGGTSGFDRRLQAIARRELAAYESRVRIRWLTELAMPELLKTVAALPEQSAVLHLTLLADSAGRDFVPHQALSQIAAAASAPVYVAVDQYVGTGAVGGHVYSITNHARSAADIGLRVLRGEAPASIPVVAQGDYRNMFDWRALQRWRLDPDKLPADSVIIERVPTLLEEYRWYIVSGTLLLLLQSALIAGLLVSRAARRRADRATQESEERRRRAEEEMQKQREDLAHALRVATLGELTASFAHEVNQPLAAILANAQAGRKVLAAGSAGEVNEMLGDIAHDAFRASEIISRLRALFRKEHTERAPLDLNALVDDVLVLLGGELGARGVELHVVRRPLPPVPGDPVQLRQVVLNLVVNAIEALAGGDGPREIHVETHAGEDRSATLTLSDSGPPVAEADLERMFERFVSTKPQGLGMGLAISRSIVNAHGGRIWATRNARRGLTLHVRLPAEAAGSGAGARSVA